MLTIENEAKSRISLFETLKAQWRVLVALMLRDIKTRWGSSIGFLIAIAWPLIHIAVLVLLYTAFGRVAPYGESSILWFTVGMFPFILISYISRFVVLGLIINKPLLIFPAIKVTDILFSRMIIEVINAAIVLLIIIIVLWYLEIGFMPHDLLQAAFAVGVSILLGLGLGVLNGLIAMMFHMWFTAFVLVLILFWITSGVMFIPSSLPAYLRDILYFQPTVHLVEWIREAYYPEYNSLILDKTFIVVLSIACVALGLALERVFRGRVMMP